jgi:putative transposase
MNYFGEIEEGKMILNEIGEMVNEYYLEIPNHFENVILDYFCIMPNHVH